MDEEGLKVGRYRDWGVIGLIVVVVVTVYVISEIWIGKSCDHIAAEAITIPAEDETIPRGRHLVEISCAGCHGEDLAGAAMVEKPNLAYLYGSNLTSGAFRERLLIVVHRRLRSLDQPYSLWTLQQLVDSMAEERGLRFSTETVRLILKANDIVISRPQHKVGSPDPDPEYEAKKRAIEKQSDNLKSGLAVYSVLPYPNH